MDWISNLLTTIESVLPIDIVAKYLMARLKTAAAETETKWDDVGVVVLEQVLIQLGLLKDPVPVSLNSISATVTPAGPIRAGKTPQPIVK
jgi:hypothetical protein